MYAVRLGEDAEYGDVHTMTERGEQDEPEPVAWQSKKGSSILQGIELDDCWDEENWEPLYTADQLQENPDAFLDTHLMYGIGDLSEAYHEGRRVERQEMKVVLDQINDDDIFEAIDEAGFDKGHDRSTASFVLKEVKERVRQEMERGGDG